MTSHVVDDFVSSALDSGEWGMVVEHERVFFPSFPYEWPPEILYAAGRLTLDLELEALDNGWELKDATPFNVLFRSTVPVFVDVPSFTAAARDRLSVLPLVVDLVNPPGGTGWRNREYPSFLERATGKFDVVLLLAVVHHLMISGGVPLREIL